ncbi:MAG: prephenate dehydratase [Lachnospiraceae bacterium]|nr:prephenate dehydratase [Lachnospiraceae bacterium]
MSLETYRKEIDEIDEKIVELYEKRMKVSEKVAEYKIANGRNVYDPEREHSKIENLKNLTHSDFNAKGTEELFSQIMSISRKKQYALLEENGVGGRLPFIEVDKLDTKDVSVVFQGVNGAYSEAAMFAYFGEGVNAHSVNTFKDAMRAIDEGTADYAVLPIENSSAGIVSANYDLLTEFENYIVAEQIIRIDNCLLGIKGSQIEDIKTVYSHPQALMQCADFLEEMGWKQISYANTAMAAKMIKEQNDPTQGAIAGVRAAKAYGLEVLKDDINFSEGNSTRFIIVTNRKIFCKDAKKISVCFEIPHKSGSLYSIIAHFIYNDLNMSKIESRPIPDRPWEYRFFIDFEGNLRDAGVRNALRGLREETRNMKILGNY